MKWLKKFTDVKKQLIVTAGKGVALWGEDGKTQRNKIDRKKYFQKSHWYIFHEIYHGQPPEILIWVGMTSGWSTKVSFPTPLVKVAINFSLTPGGKSTSKTTIFRDLSSATPPGVAAELLRDPLTTCVCVGP